MRRVSMAITLGCALTLPLTAGAQSSSGADLAARVAKLEQVLSNRGLIELLNEVERLKQDNQKLHGQVETLGYEIDRLKKSQATAYTDLDRRLQTVETGGERGVGELPMLAPAPGDAVAGTPAPQSALRVETETGEPAPESPVGAEFDAQTAAEDAAHGTEAAAASESGVDADSGVPAEVAAIEPTLAPAPLPGPRPAGVTNAGEIAPPLAQRPTLDDAASEAAYRDAFALLRAGEYDRAIAAFSEFQEKYPQSQYGDNAQYWLAESQYAKHDYAAAVVSYEKMLTEYPQSKKLSHALLKIGYSYDSLGQPEQARVVLEDLRKRFPGSAAARLAEERIEQLAVPH